MLHVVHENFGSKYICCIRRDPEKNLQDLDALHCIINFIIFLWSTNLVVFDASLGMLDLDVVNKERNVHMDWLEYEALG